MTSVASFSRRRLTENLKRVRQTIAEAAIRARRRPEDVELVVVTKYIGVDVIRMLLDMGVSTLAESRVQELSQRAAMIHEGLSRRPPASDTVQRPSWHFVGHLQRNKVRAVLPWVDLIHSVDSLRLAEEIDAQADKLSHRVPVLLQVNTADEAGKCGVAVGAAAHLAEQLQTLPRLELRGLMTMAPAGAEASRLRQVFSRTQEIFEEMLQKGAGGAAFNTLSMGMSDDFEVAVECGATMVRIGRAIFAGLGDAVSASDPSAALSR